MIVVAMSDATDLPHPVEIEMIVAAGLPTAATDREYYLSFPSWSFTDNLLTRPPPPSDTRMKDADDESLNSGSNLFVTGIHPRLTETDVSRLFEKYGDVENCSIMLDPHTKESRGFGFVKMVTNEQADAAKEGLQGEVIEGRTLSIEKARRARPRTPTPGKYFGPPKRGKFVLKSEKHISDLDQVISVAHHEVATVIAMTIVVVATLLVVMTTVVILAVTIAVATTVAALVTTTTIDVAASEVADVSEMTPTAAAATLIATRAEAAAAAADETTDMAAAAVAAAFAVEIDVATTTALKSVATLLLLLPVKKRLLVTRTLVVVVATTLVTIAIPPGKRTNKARLGCGSSSPPNCGISAFKPLVSMPSMYLHYALP